MNLEVILAKRAVEEYINNSKIFQPASTLPDELLKKRAGVFVCINRPDGQRGCMGTVKPSKKNIAKEIITNAISTAVSDSRFASLQKSDLPNISFEVYIVGKLEKIKSTNKLNPQEYGIMVKNKWFGLKSAVVLPDTNKYHNAQEQISEVCQKAGIGPAEKFDIYRFLANKHF